MALIAQQKLRIAKLERQVYGQRSERSARLVGQLSLAFEELEASATEDELSAERAVAKTTAVAGFTRKRPERNTFPDHLPRERVVTDPPTACECCGGKRLRKLGEDVTQAPAPFHAVSRGWAGPSLLAMIVFEKFGQHQPLNRQAERYALERRSDRSLDHGPRGRLGLRGVRSAPASCRNPRHGGRAPAWRRHDRAGAGRRQNRHRAVLGLRARR
jgi:transposase